MKRTRQLHSRELIKKIKKQTNKQIGVTVSVEVNLHSIDMFPVLPKIAIITSPLSASTVPLMTKYK